MTILLLDIDGPLSPFLSSSLNEEGYIHVSIGWASWSLNPKTHGKWLKELSESLTIVWCSSWESESNKVSEIYCLPEYEYIKFLPAKHEIQDNQTWKLQDVIRFLKNNDDEKVFWLDDELKEDSFAWAKYRGLEKTILVPCDPSVGWTYDQFLFIKNAL